MKIGLISDLHIDATEANREIIPYLIDAIAAEELDVFVLAGDITPNLSEFYEILGEFKQADLACPMLFVPGNHDIWVSEKAGLTSEQKCRVISEICHDNGFYALMDAPYFIGAVGFCGTIGWYDYTFAPEGYNFSTEQYAEKQLMGTVWSDKRYAKWMDTDPAVAHRFEVELGKQLDFLRNQVSRIIVVTHHVPFRECIHYRGELPWDFFRAFMGSEGLGARCRNEPLVTHVLFGHTHHQVNQQVDSVRAICAPIGYLHERPAVGLQVYAQQRLACFSL